MRSAPVARARGESAGGMRRGSEAGHAVIDTSPSMLAQRAMADDIYASPPQVAQRQRFAGLGQLPARPVAQLAQTVQVEVDGVDTLLSTARPDQALAAVTRLGQLRNSRGLREIVAAFRNLGGADRVNARRIVEAAMEEFDYIAETVTAERREMQDNIGGVRANLQLARTVLQNQRGAATGAGLTADIDEIIAEATRLVPMADRIDGYAAGAGRAVTLLYGTGPHMEASRQYILHSEDYAELVQTYRAVAGLVGDFHNRIWDQVADRVRVLDRGAVRQIVATYPNATEAKLLLCDGFLGQALPAAFTPDVLKVLVFRHGLTRAHMDVVGQVQRISAARMVAFLQDRPDLFIADLPRWEQIATAIAHQGTSDALFDAAYYRTRCAEVLAIVQAAVRTTPRLLAEALLRADANFGRISGHMVAMEYIANRLNTANAARIATFCSTNTYLENLAELHGLFQATPNINAAALLDVAFDSLAALRAREADLDRALTGQGGLTAARLRNVLAHVANNAALPAAQGALDSQLQQAQSLGAELRTIVATPIGLPANAAYLDQLAWSVNTQTGVTWGSRGGDFYNGAQTINLGASRLPVQIGGFTLSNHVLAHMINPRDDDHAIRVSTVRECLGYEAGQEYYNGALRRVFQGGGIRMFIASDTGTIITIFFNN